jgi:hypothetical protein
LTKESGFCYDLDMKKNKRKTSTNNLATKDDLRRTEAVLKTDLKKTEKSLRKDLKKTEVGLREDLRKTEASLREDLRKTEAGLREDLRKTETSLREDLKKTESGLKEDLRKTEASLREDLRKTENYLDTKIEMLKNELLLLKKEFGEFKNYVYDKLDWLVGAFQKFDEEHTILSGRYSQVREKLDNHDNHEERISALEKKTAYS